MSKLRDGKFVKLACEGHRAYLVKRVYVEQPAVLALAELADG